MKPTVLGILMASRYTLPLWLLVVSYLYYVVSNNWERADAKAQFGCVGMLVMWLLVLVKTVPKVWRYESQQCELARAGLNPEVLKQQRRRRLKQLMGILAIGAWGGSLWWIFEHSYAENPTYYLTAFVIGGGLNAFAAISLFSRLRPSFRRLSKSLSKPEKPFVVQWCQPVPEKVNGTEIAAGLPDYCKLVLSGKNEQSGTEAAPSNLVYH